MGNTDCSCNCGDPKQELQYQEIRQMVQNKEKQKQELEALRQQQMMFDAQAQQSLVPQFGGLNLDDNQMQRDSDPYSQKQQQQFNQNVEAYSYNASTPMGPKDAIDQPEENPQLQLSQDQQLQFHMNMQTRKTMGVPQQGHDFVQNSAPMRNSMRHQNQIQIKTYEQLLPKFSNEPGLEYADQFVYSNNSVYRGQMRHVDEDVRRRLQSDNSSQNNNVKGGALQNRLSARCDSVKDMQMGSSGEGKEGKSNEPMEGDGSKSDTFPTIVRHGYGVQFWTDGAHYEGQWMYNKAEGQGTFWHAEGDVYRGEFRNDMANGYGEYTHINGSKYKGEFKDDVQEGHGEEEWIDGAKYVGSYKNGMKDGYGVYKWANGSIYKGNWIQNKISGYGEYTWNDKRTYQGYWQENNMHGQGIYKWADGRRYEGDYLNDKKHGYGIYTYPDGRSYKGQWANGKQHGEGIFITPQGAQRKGIWNEGKRVKWIDDEANDNNIEHQN